MRIRARPDPENPGRPAPNTNVVCVYCDRVLRISRDRTPDRESAQTEVLVSEVEPIREARERAEEIRGKPVRRPPPPPRDPPPAPVR